MKANLPGTDFPKYNQMADPLDPAKQLTTRTLAPLFLKNLAKDRLQDFHDDTDPSGENRDLSYARAQWAPGYTDDDLTAAGKATCAIPTCRCYEWRYSFNCLITFNDTWWPGSVGQTTIAMEGADTDEGSFSKGFDEVWVGGDDGKDFVGFTVVPKALGRRFHSET